MKRFRTRTASKTYTDPGPDLLRPTANAIHEFANNMGKARTGLFVRRNAPGGRTDWQEWKGPFRRAEVLEQADTWVDKAGDAAKFQVGRMEKGDPAMKAELLAVNVRETNLSGVNEGAEMVADLARNQFAGLTIGGFACREYNGVPGSGWSDHAWGDAVDLSPGSGLTNDKLTDWCVRMAREGCMGACQQFIGSKSGRVYNYESPSYRANLGGPESHLWHVHVSYRQHYGANPHCG